MNQKETEVEFHLEQVSIFEELVRERKLQNQNDDENDNDNEIGNGNGNVFGFWQSFMAVSLVMTALVTHDCGFPHSSSARVMRRAVRKARYVAFSKSLISSPAPTTYK